MKISELKIVNFRNHRKREIDFDNKTIICGENGSGKSNILESIYLLATAKSFRADSDHEMIRYGEKAARVKALIVRSDGESGLETVIHDGSLDGMKKRFFVNGVAKRGIDFAGRLRAVMFSPTDLELVSGSPSGRRRYLDFVISQTDREYRRSLISYEKGLRQRNRLLERIREGEAERSQLFFWDRLLVKNGNYVTDKRADLLDFLSNQSISGDIDFRCVYDRSEISESRLAQYETEEVAAATTLVGPHRDDFLIETKDADQGGNYVDVSKYASRGEQRVAVLWLKKGEFNYLKEGKDMPVLLLDDIFSELDHEHRGLVDTISAEAVSGGGQVIMTTADEHLIPDRGWKIIQMQRSGAVVI